MTDTKRNWEERTLDTNADVWDKSEPIEGKLVKVESEIGPNKSKMYTFATDKDEIKVWGSTVLDDKLTGVPLNTYVKIEYEGKLKSKKGAEYHSYRVFVDLDSMPQPDGTQDTTTLEAIVGMGEPDLEMPPDFGIK